LRKTSVLFTLLTPSGPSLSSKAVDVAAVSVHRLIYTIFKKKRFGKSPHGEAVFLVFVSQNHPVVRLIAAGTHGPDPCQKDQVICNSVRH